MNQSQSHKALPRNTYTDHFDINSYKMQPNYQMQQSLYENEIQSIQNNSTFTSNPPVSLRPTRSFASFTSYETPQNTNFGYRPHTKTAFMSDPNWVHPSYDPVYKPFTSSGNIAAFTNNDRYDAENEVKIVEWAKQRANVKAG